MVFISQIHTNVWWTWHSMNSSSDNLGPFSNTQIAHHHLWVQLQMPSTSTVRGSWALCFKLSWAKTYLVCHLQCSFIHTMCHCLLSVWEWLFAAQWCNPRIHVLILLYGEHCEHGWMSRYGQNLAKNFTYECDDGRLMFKSSPLGLGNIWCYILLKKVYKQELCSAGWAWWAK